MQRAKLHQKNSMKLFFNIIIILIISYPCVTLCQETNKQAAPQTKFNISDFNYTSDNRRDPFEPVYLARVKRTKEATSLKRGYELEELKLVGILKTDKTKFAMMEDTQGKGVMFKKGDYLNNNLWVSDVVDGRVVLAYKLKNDVKNINIDIPKK